MSVVLRSGLQTSTVLARSYLLPQLGAQLRTQWGRLSARRYASDIAEIKQETEHNETDTSAETTGVIDVEEHREVVMYFDHIYPLSISRNVMKQAFTAYSMIQHQTPEQLKEKVLAIASPIPEKANITDLVPLKRDCGAFVKFHVPPGIASSDLIKQIQANVQQHEKDYNSNIFRQVLSLVWNQHPAVYSVKGTPWIEDLRRYPSTHLKVKFEGEVLTEEELYVLFRRYGVIVDILPGPEATIIFKSMRAAISAKNCITGISLNKGKSTLHLQYIPLKRVNYLTDFINNHQKIAIPILIALVATLAVLIFDPIRQWFIESKITKKYSFDAYRNNPVVKLALYPFHQVRNWLSSSYDYLDEQISSLNGDAEKSQSTDNGTAPQNIAMLWSERYEKSKQIKLWIYENINTFIIVKGPKGSGKEEFLLEHTLLNDEKLSKKILYLDCDILSKSRSDNNLIDNTAQQLGYFPVFTWTNTVSQFVDLGVQGLTGQKSGLSESKETQLKNMFSLTTQAIRDIATADYSKYRSSIERKNSRLRPGESPLEILKEEEYLQQHPECKPIIVVDKFARKADASQNDFIFPMIAEWSSALVQNNLAHVIFITADVGSVQHLNNALPNQVFKSISLSDASSSSAQQYLVEQLKLNDEHSIAGVYEPLGGRMLDLQAFVRRIKSGESPQEALHEMVNQAAEQITTFFLNNHKLEEDTNWNTAQVWTIMKLLSKSESIEYSELIKSPLFKSSAETNATLSTLEKHDLISLKADKGILDKISAGRPLFKAAFKQLIHDHKIYKLYEVDYLNTLVALENDKIKKLEQELISIQKLGDKLGSRVLYLSEKIEASNAKVVELETNIAEINSKQKEPKGAFLGIF
ncbi:mitochondrial inner membrane protein [Scheffersomyces xylosifermentans]|uniref:mitochondrial inner membrane protein n=1 Tax=Scheffersomyces xylosifermentans TaxID=1304137 RepID=UPI00315CB13C